MTSAAGDRHSSSTPLFPLQFSLRLLYFILALQNKPDNIPSIIQDHALPFYFLEPFQEIFRNSLKATFFDSGPNYPLTGQMHNVKSTLVYKPTSSSPSKAARLRSPCLQPTGNEACHAHPSASQTLPHGEISLINNGYGTKYHRSVTHCHAIFVQERTEFGVAGATGPFIRGRPRRRRRTARLPVSRKKSLSPGSPIAMSFEFALTREFRERSHNGYD